MMSPTLAPVIMNIAMTRQYSVITAWIVVTVVSKSATRVLIDTFITDWSSTMTNWAVASAISGAQRIADPADVPRAAVPAGVVSVTVRSLQPSSQGCPAEPCPSAGRLITRVLRASRSQPVMSVLRSAGPRAPGRVCPVRLRPGPPSRGALAPGIQRRKRGNRGRFCRSSCWSCRSSCDWFYTFAPTTADTPPLAHIRSPQVPVAGLAQPVLQPPEPSHPIPFGAHRSLRNPAVQPSMGSHPNSTIQRPQLTCHHRPADFP